MQDSPNDPRTVDLANHADRKALAAQGAAGTIKRAARYPKEAIARLQASKLRSSDGPRPDNQTQRTLGATQMQCSSRRLLRRPSSRGFKS